VVIGGLLTSTLLTLLVLPAIYPWFSRGLPVGHADGDHGTTPGHAV
jgi:cobalt-zinc-cadmium resistance protein CzcA